MRRLAKISFAFLILLFSLTVDPAKADFNFLKSVHWLALNIYYESGNQPTLGKIAVGVVTLNRMRDPRYKDPRYSDDVEGVVKQYKQFSWYNPNVHHYSPRNIKAWNECVEIAKYLLKIDNDHAIITMFDGITHFHATYVSPDWRKSMVRVAHIGDHIFYRKRSKI